jgi:hypothetical protein
MDGVAVDNYRENRLATLRGNCAIRRPGRKAQYSRVLFLSLGLFRVSSFFENAYSTKPYTCQEAGKDIH